MSRKSNKTTLKSSREFSFNRMMFFAGGFALIGALLSYAVFAAPGGKGGGGGGKPSKGTSSLSVVMVTDANADGKPNWADTVTFSIQTTATTQPNVNLSCSQNGTVVYGAVAGFYEGYPWPWTVNMELKSTNWSSGGANCTAVLNYYSGTKVVNLASLEFTVSP
jgi:hypothetical protein